MALLAGGIGVASAACGSTVAATQTSDAVPTSTAAQSAPPSPAFTETTTPMPVPTSTATPGPAAAPRHDENAVGAAKIGADPTDLVGMGEKVYQETAGGVGCQYCHGTDAMGMVGLSIVGRKASEITGALDRVEMMAFIFLTPEEIQAVSAYLQSLETME